mgnify:CR=1 FL=1
MAYANELKVDVGIARIFNTYGPRMRLDDGRVVPAFIGQALRGEPMTLFGDGSQTRSFCYVDDLVAGLLALMDSGCLQPVVRTVNGQADYRCWRATHPRGPLWGHPIAGLRLHWSGVLRTIVTFLVYSDLNKSKLWAKYFWKYRSKTNL